MKFAFLAVASAAPLGSVAADPSPHDQAVAACASLNTSAKFGIMHGFGDIAATLHGSCFISADDADLIRIALDAVALRSCFGLLLDGERDLLADAFGLSFTLDFGGCKLAGSASARVVGELEGRCRGQTGKKKGR